MNNRMLFTALLTIGVLHAQKAMDTQETKLKAILQRLDSLEQQNRVLTDEVRALRQELTAARVQSSPPAPPAADTAPANLEERVAVNESRIQEQAQTKIEASQKFPISLTGMLLFNTFHNSYSTQTPASYYLLNGPNQAGATLRQTMLGLQYENNSLPGGGKLSGDLNMDFYSGGPYPSNNWLRLRTAELSFDWGSRSFMVGQEKPLISPYDPSSLAEVGVLPLAGSGNLWLWLPQARYEERLHFGSKGASSESGLKLQAAVLQTQETYAYVPPAYSASLENSRPALEGRLDFWHKWGDNSRIEIAPGFHLSTTHVAGTSVESRIASLDWLAAPWTKLQFSGAFFEGRNMANIGAIPDSFTLSATGAVIPVHGGGGWFQASYLATSRLTLNLFSGIQADRSRDLAAGGLLADFTYAGNLIYRLAPNVLIGLEALQLRAAPLGYPTQLHNHYDLSVAYLF